MLSKFWMRLRIRTKGLLLVLPAIIAAGVVAVIMPRYANEEARFSEAVRLLLQYDNLLQDLMHSELNAETGIRGFALTLTPAFLEPYEDFVERIPKLMEELEVVSKEVGFGQQEIAEIRSEVTAQFEHFLLIRHSSSSMPGLRDEMPALFAIGKETMDAMRTRIDTLRGKVAAHLLEARQKRDGAREQMLLLAQGAVVVVVVCSLISAFVYQVSIARRIASLEQETRRFGQLDTDTAGRKRDEIASLQEAFNEMAVRVELREKEMEEAAQHLEGVLQSISEAFIATDQSWRITYLNGSAEELLRVTRTEAIGRSFWNLAPLAAASDSRPLMEETCERVEATIVRMPGPHFREDLPVDAQEEYEVKVYPSGDGVAMLWQEVAARDEANRVRETLERERRIQAAREHAIVRSAIDAIFSLDAQGRFIEINPAAERLWAIPRHALAGQMFTQVIELDDHVVAWEALRAVLGGEQRRLELRCRGESGRIVPMAWSMMSAPDGSQIFCLAHDITAQKRSQQQIREARDRALDAARSKSEFLANVSHELRTPLSGITGMADLCLQTALSPEQQEYMGMLRDSAARLQGMVESLLDYSRLETGGIEIRTVRCSPIVEIERCVRAFARSAAAKGLNFCVQIQPNFPASCEMDVRRVIQILSALLDNAVKFTTRGEIVVQVEIPATAGELSLLRFRVRDTGPGVQDEKREQIFEGFLQGDGSATRKHGGAGVGLAICRQLAELLGGRLGLESQSGDGSLFWFEIPVDVIDASPVLQRSAQPYGGVLALVRSPGWRDALYQWAEWLPVSTEVELTRELDAEAVERRFSACALPPMLFLETSLLPKTGAAVILEKLALSAAAKGGGLVVAGPGAAEMQTGAAWEPGVCFVNAMAITEWCRIFRMDFPQSSEFQSAEHGSEKSEAAAHPLALVIEDNDVQQKMLEATLLRLGWEVLVRDNPVGIEALIAESRPTLILLDLTLAGHSAHAVARRIREAEHNNGKAACAMVGLSSRSRHSDLEACLSVGMNDCLVKPLAESALEEVVRRHCKLPTAWSASDQRKRRGPAMDFHRIESLCGGDEAMVKELLERFRKELPSRIAAISHELSRQNARAFQTEVERLHGSLLDLDCKSASAVTSRLLKVEPATLWLRGERLLAELTGELDLVRTAIEERVGSATEIHSA